MPLKKGTSKKTFELNLKELMGSPGIKRQKAVNTLAKKYNISNKEAKLKQSLAIAYAHKKKK